MNEFDRTCLDTFPEWLKSLGEDAKGASALLEDTSIPEGARRYLTGSLNYLFKSLDLISDGIEDLGFLDDAFVLRVAAALALEEVPTLREAFPKVARLADDASLVRSLLDALYPRLEAYVKRLRTGVARGRSVDDILADEGVRRDFLNEVSGWSVSYEAPTFTRDEKNLVKLKSFLSTQLP
jgi:uncharacterized membrane protein YkvA (DUF1232 family)